MYELIHTTFQTLMPSTTLDYYRTEIQPNTQWADSHFEEERAGGQPLNPGETWKQWPYALSADKFRTQGEAFSHSYAERFWPKHANRTPGGFLTDQDRLHPPRAGIRFDYGDLQDVVNLLAREPDTRQAYIPIWFPEDTGAVHGERLPCTIGYHLMMRNDQLHVFYAIRSCDFLRHFRDDLYLTVRLVLWILEHCQRASPADWGRVKPGLFTFWAGSLHVFQNDYRKLFGE